MRYITFISLFLILSACDSQQSTVASVKQQVVKANEEILNKGNLDYADQVFANELI